MLAVGLSLVIWKELREQIDTESIKVGLIQQALLTFLTYEFSICFVIWRRGSGGGRIREEKNRNNEINNAVVVFPAPPRPPVLDFLILLMIWNIQELPQTDGQPKVCKELQPLSLFFRGGRGGSL